jgi:hypothetical protein
MRPTDTYITQLPTTLCDFSKRERPLTSFSNRWFRNVRSSDSREIIQRESFYAQHFTCIIWHRSEKIRKTWMYGVGLWIIKVSGYVGVPIHTFQGSWNFTQFLITWAISEVLHTACFLFKNEFILQNTFTGLQCNLHCALSQWSNVWGSLLFLSGSLRCWCVWLLRSPH